MFNPRHLIDKRVQRLEGLLWRRAGELNCPVRQIWEQHVASLDPDDDFSRAIADLCWEQLDHDAQPFEDQGTAQDPVGRIVHREGSGRTRAQMPKRGSKRYSIVRLEVPARPRPGAESAGGEESRAAGDLCAPVWKTGRMAREARAEMPQYRATNYPKLDRTAREARTGERLVEGQLRKIFNSKTGEI